MILAVVRGRIRETHRHVILLHKIDEPLHELGASTMILWTIISIDHERGNVGKTRPDGLPPLCESVHEAVTGHFGDHSLHKQFVPGWEKETHGGHRGQRLKIMIGGIDSYATLPTTGEGADFDDGFGIHRDP
jgi:hypothetical protein